MLPFIRELLKRDLKVVIACNEFPAINDVTFPEMKDILNGAKKVDDVLNQSVKNNQLKIVSSGSDLPVMDFRYVSFYYNSSIY